MLELEEAAIDFVRKTILEFTGGTRKLISSIESCIMDHTYLTTTIFLIFGPPIQHLLKNGLKNVPFILYRLANFNKC